MRCALARSLPSMAILVRAHANPMPMILGPIFLLTQVFCRPSFQCNYCGRIKISTSEGSDGRVRHLLWPVALTYLILPAFCFRPRFTQWYFPCRIRCDCGGKRKDGTARMHANWTRQNGEVKYHATLALPPHHVYLHPLWWQGSEEVATVEDSPNGTDTPALPSSTQEGFEKGISYHRGSITVVDNDEDEEKPRVMATATLITTTDRTVEAGNTTGHGASPSNTHHVRPTNMQAAHSMPGTAPPREQGPQGAPYTQPSGHEGTNRVSPGVYSSMLDQCDLQGVLEQYERARLEPAPARAQAVLDPTDQVHPYLCGHALPSALRHAADKLPVSMQEGRMPEVDPTATGHMAAHAPIEALRHELSRGMLQPQEPLQPPEQGHPRVHGNMHGLEDWLAPPEMHWMPSRQMSAVQALQGMLQRSPMSAQPNSSMPSMRPQEDWESQAAMDVLAMAVPPR